MIKLYFEFIMSDRNSAILPIYQTSTFCFPSAEAGERAFAIAYGKSKAKIGEQVPLIYSRVGNPNTMQLEKDICKWDGAEASLVFPSGMAAITTLCLTLLKPGDKMLSIDPVYGGAEHFFHEVLPRFGIQCDFVPAGSSRDAFETQLNKESYKLVWVETPCNPIVTLTSIGAVRTAIDNSTSKDALLAVDNTFAGPIFHQPLKHGANIVVYSMTKFFGGHSDVTAGCCMASADIIAQVQEYRTILGNIPSPNTCWLLQRSLTTLEIRMRKQEEHAKKVLLFLCQQGVVDEIMYPGLNDHDNPRFREEFSGSGSIIAFVVKGGKEKAFRILNKVKVWLLAVSLGSVESLIEHPASMTHACMTDAQLDKAKIVPGLLRASVGLEDPQILIEDLRQAFL